MLKRPRTKQEYFYFGNLYLEQGSSEEAKKNYLIAIHLGLSTAKLYNNLGIAQKGLREIEEAEKSFLKAIEINPDFPEAYNNLGNIMMLNHEIEKAIDAYKKAVKLNPYFKDAYNNLGTAWQNLGKIKKAVYYYKKAIEINPKYPDAYNNLGAAYKSLKKINTAIKIYEKAVTLRPNFVEAYFNLAGAYHDKKMPKMAIKYANKALTILPDYPDALHLLIQQLKILCAWKKEKTKLPQLEKMTKYAIEHKTRPGETPFFSITTHNDPERNMEVAKLWSNFIKYSITKEKPIFNLKNRKKRKKIRLAYLSSDYREHAIGNQIIDLFKNHNHKKFEVFAYSYGENDKSKNRKTFEKDADKFIDITKLNYIEAAKRIYKDKIDILIDLNGHTKDSRLEISALRPAPIQATYLGFPSTTGCDFFDYAITDRIITPPSVKKYYTEKLAYMPNCYQIQGHSQFTKKRRVTRKEEGLPEGKFIFCSFNNSYKITEKIFNAWIKILKQVPDSILWLLEEYKDSKENLLKYAEEHGIPRSRIIFTKRTSLEKHLQRLKLADLALDTFPYNGGATTSNALWAEVPVITLQGNTYISRMASSLITADGVPELITKNINDYVKTAVKLAKDKNKLQAIKQKIKKNNKDGPLFNTRQFVRDLEAIYTKMYNLYIQGKPPKEIK